MSMRRVATRAEIRARSTGADSARARSTCSPPHDTHVCMYVSLARVLETWRFINRGDSVVATRSSEGCSVLDAGNSGGVTCLTRLV